VLASRRFRSVRAKFIIDANEQLTSLGRLQVPNFTKRATLDVPLVDVRRPIRPHIGAYHPAPGADHPAAQRPDHQAVR
jgi:hypothetical protein